jgi:hypothetical protein
LGVNGLGGDFRSRSITSSSQDSLEFLGMFDSANQKIERAEYHISDLERQLAAIVAENAFIRCAP